MQTKCNLVEEHNKLKLYQSFDLTQEVDKIQRRLAQKPKKVGLGQSGFKDNARELYDIPTALLLDPDVAMFLNTWDKTAERRMVEKFGPNGTVAQNAIGIGGRPCLI